MIHPLIDQFRFTRQEWLRGLQDISDEDGARHFGPMNSMGWTVGHLAWHEQSYWLERAQGIVLFPVLNERYAYGAPMFTPALSEMMQMWHTVTQAVDPFLDTLTTETLLTFLPRKGRPTDQSIGSGLRRMTYHYWYHIGEIQAIRQMLDHPNRAEYVGDIETMAPYRPE